jgi:hypothetical protein
MTHGYNPDYYMTCATVIPVFLIAVIVPGGAFSRLSDQLHSEDPDSLWFEAKSYFAYMGLAVAFFGELSSLAVLRLGRTFWASSETPAIAVTWLVLLTAIGAAGLIGQSATRREAGRRRASAR